MAGYSKWPRACLFGESRLAAGGRKPARGNNMTSTESQLQSSTERRDECVNKWEDTTVW